MPVIKKLCHKFHQFESCRGFTLLEIMAAVSIIAIVLVSVYKLQAQTISMNNSVRFYTTAPLLAQRQAADIEATPLSYEASGAGDFGDEFPGYTWTVLIDDVDSETIGEAAQDLKKLDVIIAFNNNEYIYKLRAYTFLQR
ncbi:prepilin-type N-terminal cleavage/methylation domain-containing protein [Thermodesulfobacteriota bacterium]